MLTKNATYGELNALTNRDIKVLITKEYIRLEKLKKTRKLNTKEIIKLNKVITMKILYKNVKK